MRTSPLATSSCNEQPGSLMASISSNFSHQWTQLGISRLGRFNPFATSIRMPQLHLLSRSQLGELRKDTTENLNDGTGPPLLIYLFNEAVHPLSAEILSFTSIDKKCRLRDRLPIKNLSKPETIREGDPSTITMPS